MDHRRDMTMNNPIQDSLNRLYTQLSELRSHVVTTEEKYQEDLHYVHDDWLDSAKNLLYYIGLRQNDIRPIQVELGYLGLSSLGRLEAHVLAAIDSVLFALDRMRDEPGQTRLAGKPEQSRFKEGDYALIRHTDALLGQANSDRIVRIMVTMPSEAADDYKLVVKLLEAGMDVARINSAHDDQATWENIVENIRKASKEIGIGCKILFDLCGPKLRTGQLVQGSRSAHFKPKRDERGTIIEPAILWVGEKIPPPDSRKIAGVLPVEHKFYEAFSTGDKLTFCDIRGKKRSATVIKTNDEGAWVELFESIFVESSLELNLVRDHKIIARGTIGELPTKERSIELYQGDTLVITAEDREGMPARAADDGSILPATIPCTLPEIFKDCRPGQPILFDDGKISGVISTVSDEALTVIIQRTRPGGAKLRADKGINLPETNLSLPSLSNDDLKSLDFAVNVVDLIGLSFIREAKDLLNIQKKIGKRSGEALGLILKIENRAGFQNLPELLLAGLRNPPFGVMVARGDLGVEIGFERLAEVQEEIVWLCEAAHVPVIWATQVLESLAKKGIPTRAEVTDAAMSGRAECVMLNKGPYIVEAVSFLNDILLRMRDHHHKKTPMLRKLKVSEGRYRASSI